MGSCTGVSGFEAKMSGWHLLDFGEMGQIKSGWDWKWYIVYLVDDVYDIYSLIKGALWRGGNQKP
jgi:hypothetical protein